MHEFTEREPVSFSMPMRYRCCPVEQEHETKVSKESSHTLNAKQKKIRFLIVTRAKVKRVTARMTTRRVTLLRSYFLTTHEYHPVGCLTLVRATIHAASALFSPINKKETPVKVSILDDSILSVKYEGTVKPGFKTAFGS